MKRIDIDNFNGGIVNAVDPERIPDNACVDILNYEYRDLTGLKKRYDKELHELNDANLTGVTAFTVWYPNRSLAEMIQDKLYVVYYGTTIAVVYKTSIGWQVTPIFDDLSTGASVTFFSGYSRVLIADGVHAGRFIQINKELELQSGELGIEAPRYMLSVSAGGADNAYVDWGQEDLGMGVERGNILQYCYTVEDKYGVESNPSPLSTFSRIMAKYADASAPDGFKYYWKKALVSGLTARQYADEERSRLKYYNIYRRDIQYLEGTVDKAFKLVYRKPITDEETESYADTSSEDYGSISYIKGKAVASDTIMENNRIVYLGGVKSRGITFPFQFDRIFKITITNDNAIDYVDAIIAVTFDGQLPPLTAEPQKIRIFFNDLTTPIPVMYRVDGAITRALLKIPVLTRNSDTLLYLCYADTSAGVTDNIWNDYRYGKWRPNTVGISNISVDTMFDIPRVRNNNMRANAIVPYIPAPTGHISNMADGSEPFDKAVTSSTIGVDGYSATLRYLAKIESPSSGYSWHRWTVSSLNTVPTDSFVYSDRACTGETATAVFMGRVWGHRRWYWSPTVYYKKIFSIGTIHLIVKVTQTGDVTFTISISLWDGIGPGTGTVSDRFKDIYSLSSYPNTGVEVRVVLSVNVTTRAYYAVFFSDTGSVLRSTSGSFPYNFRAAFSWDYYKAMTLLHDYTASQDRIERFEVYDNTYVTTEADAKKLFYFLPVYPSRQIGANIEDGTWVNEAVTIAELTEADLSPSNEKNRVQWSDITGYYFNDLDFLSVNEPVRAVIAAPSFLKQQYQNTVVVFTRNTITRLVLNDDLTKLAQRADNVIQEYSSGGLFAVESLVQAYNSLFWLSENGVMQWSPEGLKNLSYGVIDIPLSRKCVGVYCSANSQYWLHNPDTGDTYVYHFLTQAWTRFTGIDLAQARYLNLGEDTSNSILFLDESGQFYTYANTSTAKNVDFLIETKQYRLDNIKPFRYRCKWDRDTTPTSITAMTYNGLFPTPEIESQENSPQRFRWILLPNGFWGEYIQFSLDNVEGLRSIEIDLKEGV